MRTRLTSLHFGERGGPLSHFEGQPSMWDEFFSRPPTPCPVFSLGMANSLKWSDINDRQLDHFFHRVLYSPGRNYYALLKHSGAVIAENKLRPSDVMDWALGLSDGSITL